MTTTNPPDPVPLAIIGGSGLYRLNDSGTSSHEISTSFQPEPVSVKRCLFADRQVFFLPRHGADHSLPPHRIPYKANIQALSQLGVKYILAVNAVGSINPSLDPGDLCIPDQLIDYTWGREHTYFDGLDSLADHRDFSQPYDGKLRKYLIASAQHLNQPFLQTGTYGCTQGPRLETAAEIRRMAQDGCDVVGQTGMPEAALARELGIAYASLCLVVNRAAGLEGKQISMEEIRQNLGCGMDRVRQVLAMSIAYAQKSLS